MSGSFTAGIDGRLLYCCVLFLGLRGSFLCVRVLGDTRSPLQLWSLCTGSGMCSVVQHGCLNLLVSRSPCNCCMFLAEIVFQPSHSLFPGLFCCLLAIQSGLAVLLAGSALSAGCIWARLLCAPLELRRFHYWFGQSKCSRRVQVGNLVHD